MLGAFLAPAGKKPWCSATATVLAATARTGQSRRRILFAGNDLPVVLPGMFPFGAGFAEIRPLRFFVVSSVVCRPPDRRKTVTYGICARCKKRNGCKFRQPGTWVVECEVFEPRAEAVPVDLARERFARPEEQDADQPGQK